MDPQATDGTETGTAVLEQTDADFEADVLKGFADEDSADQSTTLPTDQADTSANPDPQALESSAVEVVDDTGADPATETASDEDAGAAAVDTLETALQRIASLEEVGKKSSDTLGGRLGAMEQIVKALSANTKVKASVRAKLEKFGNFGEEYPEFAKAQVEFLNGILEELEMPAISPEFTTNLIKEASTAAGASAEQAYHARRKDECWDDLDFTHQGWRDIVGLPKQDLDQGGVIPDTAYRRWLATQPAEYQKKVTESFSATVIGKSINDFQASQRPKPVTTTTTTVKPQPSTRTQRLSAAAAPRVSGTTKPVKRTLSVDEAMELSFRGKI